MRFEKVHHCYLYTVKVNARFTELTDRELMFHAVNYPRNQITLKFYSSIYLT